MRLTALLFGLCILAGPGWAEDFHKAPQLQVGVIIPLSGELTYFGSAVRQGIEMAESEGVAPGLSFTFEDDRSGDRMATVSAIQSLVQRKQIRAAVLTGMPNVAAADSLIRRENLIALSAWDSNNAIKNLSPNTFGYGWSNERTGEQMGIFACASLKARSAAVVVAHDEWSEILGQSFSNAFESCGGRIVLHDAVELDGTDFRALSTKITRANPQVVYFPLYRASLLSFAKQIKQSGFAGTLLSAEGISEAEVRHLGKLADGMYVTSAYLSDADFENRYKAKFGLSRVELNLAHVALGYEIAKFLSSCVEQLIDKGMNPSPENLRAAVQSTTISGILGTTSFRGRKTADRLQVLLMAKDGKLSRVTIGSHRGATASGPT